MNTAHSSHYGTLTSAAGSTNKAQIELHQRNWIHNNKENEEIKNEYNATTVISSRKGSLLHTMSNAANFENAKQKRLKAFKQQCAEHYEATVDPIDLHDLQDP